MNKSVTIATLTLCILALAGCGRDPNSPSGKRHEAFEAVGEAHEALDEIFKAANPDLAAAAAPVATIKAQVAVLPSLFPEGTGPGSDQPTDALATVWTEPAEFAKKMDGFKARVAALDAAVTKGDAAAARAAATELGKTCKDCHTKFRED